MPLVCLFCMLICYQARIPYRIDRGDHWTWGESSWGRVPALLFKEHKSQFPHLQNKRMPASQGCHEGQHRAGHTRAAALESPLCWIVSAGG